MLKKSYQDSCCPKTRKRGALTSTSLSIHHIMLKLKCYFFIDMVRHVTGRTMRMFRFLGKSMVVDIIESICSISAFHHRPVDDVP